MFPKIKVCGSVIVGTKGQEVISVEARENLGIKEGDNSLLSATLLEKVWISLNPKWKKKSL